MARKNRNSKPATRGSATDQKTIPEPPISLPAIVLVNLGLVASLTIVFSALSFQLPLRCFSPFAQSFILSVIVMLGLHFFSTAFKSLNPSVLEIDPKNFFRIIGTKIIVQNSGYSLGAAAVLIGLAVLLGSYRLSPIFFSTGRIPILRGFVVTTSDGYSANIRPGETFTMKSVAWATLDPAAQPADVRCSWISARDGSFDNSEECSVVYYPPLGFSDDLLQLEIRSACQSQEFHGHLRVIILP